MKVTKLLRLGKYVTLQAFGQLKGRGFGTLSDLIMAQGKQ